MNYQQRIQAHTNYKQLCQDKNLRELGGMKIAKLTMEYETEQEFLAAAFELPHRGLDEKDEMDLSGQLTRKQCCWVVGVASTALILAGALGAISAFSESYDSCVESRANGTDIWCQP